MEISTAMKCWPEGLKLRLSPKQRNGWLSITRGPAIANYAGHIVLIPKKHINSLIDLGSDDEDLLLVLMRAAIEISRDMLAQNGGCRLITNMGGYQDTGHLHWHIVSGQRLLN